jgi:hypothetical protein
VSGKITLWGAGELLNTFFSRTAEPPPIFYVALIKDVAPTPFLSGAELDEPDAPEYERVAVVNETSVWSNEGAIQITVCETDLTFTTAQEDWGTIRYWAICNAVVDGFIYMIGKFAEPDVIDTGDTVMIPSGTLSVSLGPFFNEAN